MAILDIITPVQAGAAPRVLIIEDQYFIAMEVAEALMQFGAQPLAIIASMTEAMSILASAERIDAAVLDIQLRGDHAWSVAMALEQRGIPFVFATGYAAEAIPEAWRHIPRWEKPFDSAEMVQSLLARIVSS